MVNINKSFLNVFKGFVRFSDMNDQREALIHMNGFVGIHGHPGEPIKVKSLMINFYIMFIHLKQSTETVIVNEKNKQIFVGFNGRSKTVSFGSF